MVIKKLGDRFKESQECYDTVEHLVAVKKQLADCRIGVIGEFFSLYETFPEDLSEKLRPIIIEYYTQAVKEAQKKFEEAVKDLAMNVPW